MPVRTTLALVFLLVCTGAARPAVRLEKTPPYVLAYCSRSPQLLRGCPRVLPRMAQPAPHWDATLCLPRHPGCAGVAWADLDLVDAGYGTKPPAWSHVVLYAGDLARAFGFTYPAAGRPQPNLDGLLSRPRTRAIFIGTYTWHRRRGTVVLAPPFPGGGEQGDHLIFRWREAGNGHAIGLHAWEPLSQAFATLRFLVDSIPAVPS